jgi:hypothetical protein
MRIHFRNGDLTFRPESVQECKALRGLLEALKTAQFTEAPLPEYGLGINFPDFPDQAVGTVISGNK